MGYKGRESSDESAELKKQKRKEKASKADYDVGYCKTPAHTKFKPGNKMATGRKPKSKPLTLAEAVIAEGVKPVTIIEAGKSVKVTYNELIAKQWTQAAAKGIHGAMAKLADFSAKHAPPSDPEGDAAELSDADRAMIDDYVAMKEFGSHSGEDD